MDQIKKHYDKLTAGERFALMVSASLRNDTNEENALVNSAPKVNWEFPHTVGLSYGFRRLVKHHIAQQLGTAGTFWMLIYMSENDKAGPHLEEIEAEETPDERMLSLTARRFMEGREGFNAVCREYKIDPDAMRDNYNQYPELTAMTEIIIRRGFDLKEIELTDLENTKAAYRELIEESREYWQEKKAS